MILYTSHDESDIQTDTVDTLRTHPYNKLFNIQNFKMFFVEFFLYNSTCKDLHLTHVSNKFKFSIETLLYVTPQYFN